MGLTELAPLAELDRYRACAVCSYRKFDRYICMMNY